VLYVLRFRLEDLMSGDLWHYIGLYAEHHRADWEGREDDPWFYIYSENREVMKRIYQLGRRFEPVAMVAELS
jgi:hypothetical protein